MFGEGELALRHRHACARILHALCTQAKRGHNCHYELHRGEMELSISFMITCNLYGFVILLPQKYIRCSRTWLNLSESSQSCSSESGIFDVDWLHLAFLTIRSPTSPRIFFFISFARIKSNENEEEDFEACFCNFIAANVMTVKIYDRRRIVMQCSLTTNSM